MITGRALRSGENTTRDTTLHEAMESDPDFILTVAAQAVRGAGMRASWARAALAAGLLFGTTGACPSMRTGIWRNTPPPAATASAATPPEKHEAKPLAAGPRPEPGPRPLPLHLPALPSRPTAIVGATRAAPPPASRSTTAWC